MNKQVKISLGDKVSYDSPLRHHNDYTCEILVDITHEDGRNQELSLGFLSALHDTCNGSFLHCCVMDRHADAIPGLKWKHGSIESALSSSHDFLVDLVNR